MFQVSLIFILTKLWASLPTPCRTLLLLGGSCYSCLPLQINLFKLLVLLSSSCYSSKLMPCINWRTYAMPPVLFRGPAGTLQSVGAAVYRHICTPFPDIRLARIPSFLFFSRLNWPFRDTSRSSSKKVLFVFCRGLGVESDIWQSNNGDLNLEISMWYSLYCNDECIIMNYFLHL